MKAMLQKKESDRYFELIREFPLRPLRSAAALEAANRMALRLVASAPEGEMDAGSRDYLDALSLLIQDAEKGLLEKLASRVNGLDLLKHLMDERAMSVSDIGRVIGSQPAASLVLAGKRSISKPQMVKLADFFGLSPAAFLGW